MSLEAMNTAIERVVDLITEEYHPLAKIAKDVSAGAVLIFSFFAVLIGVLIFYKPIFEIIIVICNKLF
ncbi:diacylglycerol kinase family protein [Anaerobacillus sp. HL2]|nr:diacylglycerol kinase family protein [Anaerobacillus sp. HL2]